MPKAPTTYTYDTIAGDALGVRAYTLQNGLRVFLSVNKNEPRIFTNICFRVGSKYDPADTTGLAHYMEHMLFKGTSKIGATNWEAESALLEQIADLFETYRHTSEDEKRQELYKQIDSLSYEAALLVAPNEYDRLVTAIGGKDTNAYTWVEQTVYVNDIPSNELKRWIKLERERFRYLALRLFHTELETVYEEYNMSLAKDFRKGQQALRKLLFPTHPYGTQTTLGRPEHLKNPSMRNIETFFNTYYVPNNAAICLAGDFDPDEAIAMIDECFGDWEAVDFPPFQYEEQPPINGPLKTEVTGQASSYLQVGWRLGGGRTDDYMMGLLIRQMLYNEQAGLFDLHLNQQQRVLNAEAFNWIYEDYSILGLYGKPREGQSLEEVEQLLLVEMDKLRRGEFPDWLLEAAIRDMKQGDLKAVEKNNARVAAITTCFTLGIPWERFVKRYDWLEQVT
ncbi:MAG: pitrilysin family protein, partial [Bacteroidota bacterium]